MECDRLDKGGWAAHEHCGSRAGAADESLNGVTVDATRDYTAGRGRIGGVALSRQMDSRPAGPEFVGEQQAPLISCGCGHDERRIATGAGAPYRTKRREPRASTDEEQRRRRAVPDEVPADRSA